MPLLSKFQPHWSQPIWDSLCTVSNTRKGTIQQKFNSIISSEVIEIWKLWTLKISRLTRAHIVIETQRWPTHIWLIDSTNYNTNTRDAYCRYIFVEHQPNKCVCVYALRLYYIFVVGSFAQKHVVSLAKHIPIALLIIYKLPKSLRADWQRRSFATQTYSMSHEYHQLVSIYAESFGSLSGSFFLSRLFLVIFAG